MTPDALSAAFTDRFALAPAGIWSAPGRVNLIGEHTDYNAGFALPFAIEARAYVAVRPTDDDELACATTFGDEEAAPTVRLSRTELAADSSAFAGAGGWARYLAGVAWAFDRRGITVPGLRVLLHSDVPVGAGLSSSAAVECALAIALNELTEANLDRTELVQICHEAENNFVGAPTGILDQSASLLSVAGSGIFLDCRDRTTRPVPLDLAAHGLALLIIDTRVTHAHESGGYRDRVASCVRGARLLGVETLREVDLALLAARAEDLDEETLRRVRHIVTENARVEETVGLLDAGLLDQIGPILTASHASMRDDYEISSSELDAAVEASLRAGAIGARMTGGGFGGSAIALVAAEGTDAVRAAVREGFASRGWAEPRIYETVPGPGAHRDI
ncbi:galactokinase [Mycetocola tolaasinivorans]|uniref:Galactokinase n=1 Tax=Mycetocola tolaasinivorans TaxID=76635 RepID=A0A3L7A5M6_9MICO|nr:galactokinase [Mycetocola tolaasinivorans]RLP75619.1 galactokinase [Mycetocola tolaasinivorans]